MIISDKFIWLHVGKTGGTSIRKTLRIIKNRIDPSIELNDDKYFNKHDSIKARTNTHYDTPFKYSESYLNSLDKILNIRRLPSYLMSRSQWNEKHHNARLGKTFNKEILLEGFATGVSRHILDHCESTLNRFIEKSKDVKWITCEHLNEDFLQLMKTYYDLDEDTIRLINDVRINVNTDYDKNIHDYFTDDELVKVYNNCPTWKELELKLYGNIII